MKFFGNSSAIVNLVNNFDEYREQGDSFKEGFKGHDPEEVESHLEKVYDDLEKDLSKEDEEYFLTNLGLEEAEDEIQDIEMEENYMDKLDRAIEARGKKVKSREDAIYDIEEVWGDVESYFEETSRLLEAWESFLEMGEKYGNVYLKILEHFNQVHEPIELKSGGIIDFGEVSFFNKKIREWLEERKDNFQKAKKEYEEIEVED